MAYYSTVVHCYFHGTLLTSVNWPGASVVAAGGMFPLAADGNTVVGAEGAWATAVWLAYPPGGTDLQPNGASPPAGTVGGNPVAYAAPWGNGADPVRYECQPRYVVGEDGLSCGAPPVGGGGGGGGVSDCSVCGAWTVSLVDAVDPVDDLIVPSVQGFGQDRRVDELVVLTGPLQERLMGLNAMRMTEVPWINWVGTDFSGIAQLNHVDSVDTAGSATAGQLALVNQNVMIVDAVLNVVQRRQQEQGEWMNAMHAALYERLGLIVQLMEVYWAATLMTGTHDQVLVEEHNQPDEAV
jgi:hypothetical protein